MDLPHDQLALDAAQAVDEEGAVEVIHFVLKRPREQAGAFVLLRLAVPVDHGLQANLGAAFDRRQQVVDDEIDLLLTARALGVSFGD